MNDPQLTQAVAQIAQLKEQLERNNEWINVAMRKLLAVRDIKIAHLEQRISELEKENNELESLFPQRL